MNKAETASYLYTLHSLMQAQSSGPRSTTSGWLADEYNREWENLKEMIRKDQEDEARKRDLAKRGPEAGADRKGS